jgi:hypothetical protein
MIDLGAPYTRNAMGLFDPNRLSKPYPMLTPWKRVAIGALILVVVVVGLLILLPAFVD